MKFQKSSFSETDFMEIAGKMLQKCEVQDFHLFVSIARKIWMRRNDLLHEGVFLHPKEVVTRASMSLQEYTQAQNWVPHTRPSGGAECMINWRPPPLGWLKVNWDAAVDKSNGRIGLGVVIRDHLGQMYASKSQTRHGYLEPVAAEAMAALLASLLCCEMRLQQVMLEGDAKVIVDAVNARETVWTRWGHLVEDILQTLQAVGGWKMGYVRREANNAAHVLARLAAKQNMNNEWLNDPPESLLRIIASEIPTQGAVCN